jgi:hypothetical protein
MTGLRAAACVGLMLYGLVAPGAARAEEGKIERPFGPGRRVWMDLSSGDYRIQPGSDDRILVRWEAQDPDGSAMRVNVDARGSDGSIVTAGESRRFVVVIELPSHTDITIRLSAGDLRIRGIAGHKDVSSWAGKIEIEVSNPADYRTASAKVTAGDLNASAFDVKKGGLFRSFSWQGPGRYDLIVRLTAGDVRLTR